MSQRNGGRARIVVYVGSWRVYAGLLVAALLLALAGFGLAVLLGLAAVQLGP